MGPINGVDIAQQVFGFLILGTLIGNPVRIFLLRPSYFEGETERIEVKWILSLASGVALLPLVLVWLGLFSVVATLAVTVITICFLAANLAIYRRDLRGPLPSVRRSLRIIKTGKPWFALVLLGALLFHFLPLQGLWVTPGDDAKLYSLITQRVIETGGVPGDWGGYAERSWYEERTHLLLPGFSSIVSFQVLLLGIDVPTAVSIISSMFRVLTSATLYLLAWTLTGRRIPSLVAAATYGLVVLEPPVAWFSWGGMAELAGISLLPVAAAGTYAQSRVGFTHLKLLFWISLIVSGMSLLHPFAFFYYLAFVIPLTGVLLWRNHDLKTFSTLGPAVLGLAFIAGPLFRTLPAENSISELYSIYNAAWTPILGWSMSFGQAASNIIARTVVVYGAAGTILLITGLLVSRRLRPRKHLIVILGAWWAMLFVLHENNPNGLFLIPFPLWYRIDANRAFAITSLPVAVLLGVTLEQVVGKIKRRLSEYRKGLFHSLRPARREGILRLAALGVALLLITSQIVWNAGALSAARSASPVGQDDIRAFDWIRTETTSDATFLVNWADAGTWIPIYANRRVVIPFGVVTNHTALALHGDAIKDFSVDPGSLDSVRYLESTGVTHIYAGPARIYGRAGFDPSRIIASGVYQEEYHGGDVWIFRLKA